MKRIFISLLFALSLQNAFSQKNDIEKLTKLNQDWISLSIKKDTAAFAKIFADDFVLISPNGTKRTKWDIVKNTLYQDIKSQSIDSINVGLLTNDVGLITCYTTFVLISDGKEVTGKNCYQDVYIKRKDRWFAIAAHVTLLNIK
jgi:uncharacterized protein (TIGR02246 family)